MPIEKGIALGADVIGCRHLPISLNLWDQNRGGHPFHIFRTVILYGFYDEDASHREEHC